MTKNFFTLRATLAALGLIFLVACGGGGDDGVPFGAKVCELRQVPAGSLIPRTDVIDYEPLKTPELVSAGDSLFVVDYPFAPGSSQQLPNATITFFVQQFGYRATSETRLWECALRGLSAGDRIALQSGPRDEGQRFYVSAMSELTLVDGRTASSERSGFWIEY